VHVPHQGKERADGKKGFKKGVPEAHVNELKSCIFHHFFLIQTALSQSSANVNSNWQFKATQIG
jgi:hypothetical protein